MKSIATIILFGSLLVSGSFLSGCSSPKPEEGKKAEVVTEMNIKQYDPDGADNKDASPALEGPDAGDDKE